MARETFEGQGDLEELRQLRLFGDQRLDVGVLRQEFLERRRVRARGNLLRDAIDFGERQVERATDVADDRARRHRPERDDLRDMIAAVAASRVFEDALASLHAEVDVDVGHRHARAVQEAFEKEVVAQRIDLRDAEQVGHDRSRRRSAPRSDGDAVRPRPTHEIPHDEEVRDEAQFADDALFVVEARARGLVSVRIQARESFLEQSIEDLVRRFGRVRREDRQPVLAELDLEVHLLRDVHGRCDATREITEVVRHLRACLEVQAARLEPKPLRVRTLGARVDAQEHVLRLTVLVAQVVDVVRADEGDARLLVHAHQGFVDLRLRLDAVALQFEPEMLRAEQVAPSPGELERLGFAIRDDELRHLAREATRETGQPARVLREQLAVDARPEVVALEVRRRCELDEVLPTLRVTREQSQVVVTVSLGLAVRFEARASRDVDLATEDRLHAAFLGGLVELDGAEEVAVVRERDRRLLVRLTRRDEIRDPVRPVEEAVLGVDVEVDEIGVGHRRAAQLSTRRLQRTRARWNVHEVAGSECVTQHLDGPRAARLRRRRSGAQ